MPTLAFIPWFRPGPLEIPLPFAMPVAGDAVSVRPFTVLVVTGVLVGAWVAVRFGRRNALDAKLTRAMLAYAVVCGFAGAYALDALFYQRAVLQQVIRHPWMWSSTHFGMSSYGGFFGAIVGAFVWRWRRNQALVPYADALAFGLPFGWLFGRTGCFLAHDHPGRHSDFFLAVADYQFGAPPFQPRHDLGLYEALYALAIMALFLWLARKRRTPGFYLALLPLLYAPVRFCLDFLRVAPQQGGDVRNAGLTPAQWASIAMLLIGVAMARHLVRSARALASDPYSQAVEVIN